MVILLHYLSGKNKKCSPLIPFLIILTLNFFDILRTKISFLVVKIMGALPDAEAGWVQAFPCCFGA
jgi:hypothetical protein